MGSAGSEGSYGSYASWIFNNNDLVPLGNADPRKEIFLGNPSDFLEN